MRVLAWAIRIALFVRPARVRREEHRPGHACASTSTCAWQAPLVAGAARVLRRRRGARPARDAGHLYRAAAGNRAPAARTAAPRAAKPAAPVGVAAAGGGGLMEFEFWWLLGFPLFFGLGWLAARIDIKHLVTDRARAAALVLQGPQFPAQRAAGQGDRGLHRGGQGRPGNRRAAFRAGQPVPPARRVPSARSACTSNLLERARPRRRAARRGAVRAGPGLPQGRAARPRRGGVPQARGRLAARTTRSRAGRAASCSRSTSRKRTGRRPIGDGARAREGDRASRARKRDRATSTASWRRPRRRIRGPTARARYLEAALEANRKMRARQPAAGRPARRPRATSSAPSQHWKRIESAESGLSRAGGAAPAGRATARSASSRRA